MIIEKPLNYIRDFKGGILDNKLKYCIIKDINIDYSCVACCVGVGSRKDPKEFNGLAHFLEHMLFLGSKKYPDSEYFNHFISQNGGFANAYTSFMETNYYYKINNDSLEKSMDIFSRFFIDPLFDEKLVNREVNAVNSEHNKNINSDFWLIRQIILNLSNPDSVINTFSTGNNETLNKKETRDEMIKFFNKYYCSENITITILSPNDINDVEEMVKKIFGKIKHKKCHDDMIIDINNDMPKYSIKNKEYQLFPVNNTKDFEIVYFWDVNYHKYYNDDKSIYIISDIINDFRDNSYFHYLKSNGYIHSLNTMNNDEGVFFLMLNINKEKYNDIKKLINEINSLTFNFFNSLKNSDKGKMYDYYSKKYELNYLYGDKEYCIDMVPEICVNMLNYPIKNYYNGNKIVIKKDLNKFNKTINELDFKNVNILYYYDEDLGVGKKMKENYYKATYGPLNNSFISDNLKDTLKNNLKDNLKNTFNIVNSNKYFDVEPTLIKNLDKYEIPSLYNKRQWYGGVSRFNEYNVMGKLILTNSSLYNTIESYISTIISIQVINYYLALNFSDITDIGFYTRFSPNSEFSNIVLTITGLNDKYNNFFNDVIDYLKKIKPEDNILQNYIKSTINDYKHIKTASLSSYVSLLINYMTNDNIYHFNDILKILNTVDLKESIKKRINTIINFKNLSASSVFYGNIKPSDLPNTNRFYNNYNYVKNKISSNKLIKSNTFKKLNKNDTDILVIYSYYCSNFNPLKIVKLLILFNLIDNESYNYLRTRKQLGYSAGSSIKKVYNDNYLFIKVQSSKSEKHIKDTMNEFIEYFKKFFINKISDDKEFKTIKSNIKKLINLESNSTQDLFYKYYYEIFSDRYFFNKDIILTNQLDKINKDDMIKFMDSLFKKKEIIVIN